MTSRPGIFTQIWERSTLLTLVGMVIVILLVTVIIVGTGLHSAFVWLILAGICIAWVFACSCSNCKKMANLRLRRTSEHSDTISTISDLSYIGDPRPVLIDDGRDWAQDLPPSYDVVSNTREQQPPSYASVIALLNPFINRQRIDIPGSQTLSLPPPYVESVPSTNVIINTATTGYTDGTHTGNSSEIITINISRSSEEPMQQNVLPSREHARISIISGCNLNDNVQKITNDNRPVIDSPELTTLSNDNQNIPTRPADVHLHSVNSEPRAREHSSIC